MKGYSEIEIQEKLKKIEPQIKNILEHQSKLLTLSTNLNEELKSKNQEFQNIIESLPNGLIAIDNKGIIVHFNLAVSFFTQISAAEARGIDINRLFQRKIIPENFGIIKKDQHYQQRFFFTTKSNEVKNIEYKLVPLPTDAGIIIHMEDITLIEKLKKEADIKNRLITMGKMAASVAHEIRNPLASIKLFTSMLAKEFQSDPEKLEILNYIEQSTTTANYVISNLLSYTKQIEINKKTINIKDLVNKFYLMNQYLAQQQGYELIFENKIVNSLMEGDEELINQLLNNIFNNARQAIEKSQNDDSRIAIKLFNQKETNKIVIEIQDWGCGMPESVKNNIFNAFYSTKKKGIGLGMFITKNIIDKHSGTIKLESFDNQGTTVRLEFNPI